MLMRVIVDGYNFIRQSPELSRIESQGLEAARRELVRRLSDYRHRKGHQIVVVFDAAEGIYSSQRQEWSHGISIAYSKRGETADEVIKRLASTGREGVVVVTSDRELAIFAEKQGSTTIRSDEFEQKMIRPTVLLAQDDLPEEEEEDRSGQRKKGNPKRLPKARRQRQAKLLQL
jgi:hypothetical protein